jgi:hypothetical protein
MTEDDPGNGRVVAAETLVSAASATPMRPRDARLGEELPIFCERCGYSLNGLTQIRCERCEVLHFACPECNHHQPINTLRPAVQRALGRLRALGLAWIVFVKINYFFWPLFAWGALGSAIAYRYDYNSSMGGYHHAPFETEGGVIIFLFSMAFAMIGRMLLLRWRHGVLIGLTIGALVALAMYIGAYLNYVDTRQPMPPPMSDAFFAYMLCGFLGAAAGAACAWGVWLALVTAFLPKRAATALLEYQRAMSAPKGAPDRTDATTSVTV